MSDIGPYAASADGNANTPVPMMDPTIKAVAVGNPRLPSTSSVALTDPCCSCGRIRAERPRWLRRIET
jgi:hypothetical protein